MTPEPTRERRRAIWTRYWRSGAQHSCTGSWGDNYGGSIRRYWETVAASLPAGAKVLDLASGNAPVPRLLAECRGSRPLEIEAIDLADIEPEWIRARLANQTASTPVTVGFLGGTSAEDLPFAAGRFDLVTSQYGLEYCDVARAASEVARVLHPGGRLSAVVHHRDSVIVRVAQEEARHIAWLLAPSGLLDAAVAMAAPLARASTAAGRAALGRDAAAGAVRDRFNALQGEAEALIARSPAPDILHEARNRIAQALQATVAQADPQVARASLAAYRDALDDGTTRLRELVDAAWDATGCDAHLHGLRDAGLPSTAAPLHDEGRLIGWVVEGRKKGEA